MRISIITLALDAPPHLDEAIASVSRPDGIDIEHIILHDGAEFDFVRLTQRYPSLRVLRGRGRGPAAAANEALRQATGAFVFFLNSDDRMGRNAISALVGAARKSPQVEVWTGTTRLFTNTVDGREVALRVIADPVSTALTLTNVFDDIPLLTARFIRREIFERFYGLSEHFYTCSDREFMVRLALANVAEAPLNELVSELRFHDGSTTIRSPGNQEPTYLSQHVELARRWLVDPTLSVQQRAAFKDWHARELLRLVYYKLRAGEVREAIGIQLAGFGADPIWPWRTRTTFSARRLRRRGDRIDSF